VKDIKYSTEKKEAYVTTMIRRIRGKLGLFFLGGLIVFLVRGEEIFEKLCSNHAQRKS
jgi:hypothetical protein